MRDKKKLVSIVALALAALVFLAVAGIGRYVVDHKYMSPASVSARKAEIYAAFSGFVQKQELRGDDSAALAAWDAYGEYVSIHVFSPDGEGGGMLPTVSQYAGQYGKLFPLRFADGLYHIAIHDNTRARELMINNIAAVAAASVVFLLVLLGYVRRLTMRILRLSEEALTIGSDVKNLDGLNYLEGKTLDFVDEKAYLGTLAAHVDGGVPVITMDCGELNDRKVGELFYFLELCCGVSAYILGVNPFNQPGVEMYKRNMFRLLGKPGYED